MSMALATLAYSALAYLIGSIPFGYLIPRVANGIDIRTVGSGNIGATNVGRTLGFRYFLLVMVLDGLKGFLPTLFAAEAVLRMAGRVPPEAPIATAAAAIVGHNFPIYLGFKGGKGVATSLGAVLALDPVAGLIAAAAFLFTFATTRVVSVSSILGAVCFLGAYFARVPTPLDRRHASMTVALLALFVLMVVRHRSNLKRLWLGTEPRVSFRRRPTGRAGPMVLLCIVVLGVVGTAAAWARRPRPVGAVVCGPIVCEEVARIGTGHQRAGDLIFTADGERLVVACPRYQRLLFYRVLEAGGLKVAQDVRLDGRPVALAEHDDLVYALQRPHGDARHLEEAFWETFDADGGRVGSKVRVGWDADDLAIDPTGRTALVLTSGNAEGEENRPAPALETFDLGSIESPPRRLGRLEFDGPGDDPVRLILSEWGGHAAVVLDGSMVVAAVDVRDPSRPSLIARTPLVEHELPTLSRTESGDPILMPVGAERETIVVDNAIGPILASTLPEGSALELVDADSRRLLGRVPLKAAGGWNDVIPMGLAASRDGRLLAVASRAGGVHLIAVRSLVENAGGRVAGLSPGRSIR